MNTKEIAKKYSINQRDLDAFVLTSNFKYKSTLFNGIEVSEDPDVVYDAYIKNSETDKNETPKELAQEEGKEIDMRLESEKKVENNLDSIIITSTPMLSGYKVLEYCGIVSVVLNGIGFEANKVLPPLIKKAEENLKAEASSLGANAVIGITFSPFMQGASIHLNVYGTAVKVEKS